MDKATPGSTSGGFFAVFSTIALPMFLAVVDQTIVSTALPSIALDLGGVERISWVVVGYLVATSIAAPIYGQMRDVHGGRRMFLIALGVFMSASLMCALARSMEMLVAARVMQGLGGGGLMTLSQARIGEAIPPRERARYQGYLAAVVVTSSTFGPVVGGFLTDHFGWQSIFLINLPLGLVAVLQAVRMPVTAITPTRTGFDFNGLACFVMFIVPLLIALELVQRATTANSAIAVSMLVVSAISGGLLVRQERAADRPLFPISLLGRPAIWRSDALAACHGATLVSLVTVLPLYSHVMIGSSAAETGLYLLPLMVGLAAGSTMTGRYVSKTGLTTIFPSIGLTVAALLLLALTYSIDWLGAYQLGGLLLLLGMSMGTVMGVVQVTVQGAAGTAMLGSAAASVQLSRSLGAAVGTAIVSAILFRALLVAGFDAGRLLGPIVTPDPSGLSNAPLTIEKAALTNAFRAAFLAIATFAALGIALARSIPAKRL